MTKLVSFEIAVLLKGKGYNGRCEDWSYLDKNCIAMHYDDKTCVKRPTIGQVVMWLYKKYGIWINVGIYVGLGDLNNFQFDIQRGGTKTINSMVDLSLKSFTSPTESYTSAIWHTLNNLI